uniref:Uncharacterized protein n=1 Tax=Chromera velia CCMP2878 TaxID=1169474 RepID=A0A0G4FE26_9ALVE|eukprot:Cvel_3243.t1-p1 / transcript=Cvel_3243.t1 / gene=Cvel_3243 / organism=Chromera_velia_CCMP2878 / gene_product=hypothetical protein / transcript_product=hypothetical protein / location=Cvel_scaffold127:39595-52463(-) / protein_length=1182 / sequence_SO=supercontig / SO=protein_coding / is_pseudo=false
MQASSLNCPRRIPSPDEVVLKRLDGEAKQKARRNLTGERLVGWRCDWNTALCIGWESSVELFFSVTSVAVLSSPLSLSCPLGAVLLAGGDGNEFMTAEEVEGSSWASRFEMTFYDWRSWYAKSCRMRFVFFTVIGLIMGVSLAIAWSMQLMFGLFLALAPQTRINLQEALEMGAHDLSSRAYLGIFLLPLELVGVALFVDHSVKLAADFLSKVAPGKRFRAHFASALQVFLIWLQFRDAQKAATRIAFLLNPVVLEVGAFLIAFHSAASALANKSAVATHNVVRMYAFGGAALTVQYTIFFVLLRFLAAISHNGAKIYRELFIEEQQKSIVVTHGIERESMHELSAENQEDVAAKHQQARAVVALKYREWENYYKKEGHFEQPERPSVMMLGSQRKKKGEGNGEKGEGNDDGGEDDEGTDSDEEEGEGDDEIEWDAVAGAMRETEGDPSASSSRGGRGDESHSGGEGGGGPGGASREDTEEGEEYVPDTLPSSRGGGAFGRVFRFLCSIVWLIVVVLLWWIWQALFCFGVGLLSQTAVGVILVFASLSDNLGTYAMFLVPIFLVTALLLVVRGATLLFPKAVGFAFTLTLLSFLLISVSLIYFASANNETSSNWKDAAYQGSEGRNGHGHQHKHHHVGFTGGPRVSQLTAQNLRLHDGALTDDDRRESARLSGFGSTDTAWDEDEDSDDDDETVYTSSRLESARIDSPERQNAVEPTASAHPRGDTDAPSPASDTGTKKTKISQHSDLARQAVLRQAAQTQQANKNGTTSFVSLQKDRRKSLRTESRRAGRKSTGDAVLGFLEKLTQTQTQKEREAERQKDKENEVQKEAEEDTAFLRQQRFGKSYPLCEQRYGTQAFQRPGLSLLDVAVIAVRGTTIQAEVFADLSLWSSIAVLQVVNNYITPVLSWLPKWWTNKMLTSTSIFTGYNIVRFRGEMEMDETAPSAGSASWANKVAENAKNSLKRWVTAVIPSYDLIPKVDKVTGLIQHIDCFEEEPLPCHSMTTILCALACDCGDDSGQMRSRCEGFSKDWNWKKWKKKTKEAGPSSVCLKPVSHSKAPVRDRKESDGPKNPLMDAHLSGTQMYKRTAAEPALQTARNRPSSLMPAGKGSEVKGGVDLESDEDQRFARSTGELPNKFFVLNEKGRMPSQYDDSPDSTEGGMEDIDDVRPSSAPVKELDGDFK